MARAGYEVSSAADGDEALRLAREEVPDLILLDMMLPKVSGPDVLKALKGDPATAAIPVVVLSGLSQKNAEKLEAAGAFAFLEKSLIALDKGPGLLLARLGSIKRKLTVAGHKWK
jgi:CheY-like chemotaxis protein